MHFLYIDTALDKSLAALFHNQTNIGAHSFMGSRDLLKSMESLLGGAGLSFQDLDFIAAGSGPGSYTGIRMGVATAKALAFARGIPVYSLSSLSTFSDKDPVIFDAKSGGIYVQEPKKAPYVIANEDIDKLSAFPKLLTPSLKPLEKKLSAYKGALEEVDFNLALIGALGFEIGQREGSSSFQVLYLKKTQAEIEKERRSLS